MLGMISFSHCLRKESLSKVGSAFRISVSTSDISVLEKRPPGKQTATSNLDQKKNRNTSFIVCRQKCLIEIKIMYNININYERSPPRKSVTRSVTALDALTRVLSLSSYFIFISKNPVGNKKERVFISDDGGFKLHLLQQRYHCQDKHLMTEVYSITLQYTATYLVPPAAVKGNYTCAYSM